MEESINVLLWYDTVAAAKRLGIYPGDVIKLIHAGALIGGKVSGKSRTWYVEPASLEQAIAVRAGVERYRPEVLDQAKADLAKALHEIEWLRAANDRLRIEAARTRRHGRKPLRRRFEILKRDGYRCRYCGRSGRDVLLEIDHVIAVTKGGTDDDDNLVTSCGDCNAGKSNRLAPPPP